MIERRPTRGFAWSAWVFLGAFGATTDLAADPPAPSPAQVEAFETQVRPVLVKACQKCHGPTKQTSDLRVDSRESLLKGGATGPAIVPGDPDASLLIQAVRRTHEDLAMPPKEPLAAESVSALTEWVRHGAPWPTAGKSTAAPNPAETHWAFQKVRTVTPPVPKDAGRIRTPVDNFLLTRLEAAGLSYAPEADRRTLLRRLAFDLTGLPPTFEEVEAFEKDTRPDAYERQVERLLASPAYGERWARHWLDVARYADTKGYVFNAERRYAYSYTYRDYVVRALNQDKPYDQFVREQLAADRLNPAASQDPGALAALGFLTVGRRFLNVQEDIIDDRIDVVSRGLLGLTVACARCHDHKYDPIPSEDYYSLYGVFASSVEPAEPPVIPGAVPADLARDFEAKVAAKQKELDTFVNAKRDEIQKEIRGKAEGYLKAAVTLNFEGRNAKLDEIAKPAGLNSSRLRGVMLRWKNHVEATRDKIDPIMAPWHAFAGLPTQDFSRRAPSVAKSFVAEDDPKQFHPLLATAFDASPPGSMEEVAATYGRLLAEADRRGQAAKRPLDDAAWESLRQFIQGPGPFTLSAEDLPRAIDRAERNKYSALNNAVQQIRATHPGSPPRAMVLNDAPNPVDPRVFIRGNSGRPGKTVPRQFLKLLSGPERKPFREGSGRKELAEAITRPDNPLTARVFVNRVWLQHFGAGLVTSPSDFGSRSDPPSHPELLDWLADDFVRQGWSIKQLHRRMVLSSAYRQQSLDRPEGQAKDPENRLLWRANRRRLEFEALRDAILTVSGTLDPTMGGRGVELFKTPYPTRRTLYGYIDRQNLEGVYRIFDFASPDASSPRRFATTVPQQALFLMNNPFVIEQARRLSSRAEAQASDPSSRVDALYRLTLAREPEAGERSLALAFVGRVEEAGRKAGEPSPWETLAQTLLFTNEFVFAD